MKLARYYLLAGIFLAPVFGQAAGLTTNTITFGYTNRAALLADGWSFMARTVNGVPRDTETTNGITPPDVSYDQTAHLGVLRLPAGPGDLFQDFNTSLNTLFRSLATNWVSVRLKSTFAPTQNVQQLALLVYQDDDNYVAVNHFYNGFERVGLFSELGGHVVLGNVVPVTATNLHLRLDRDLNTGNVTALYSPDGTNWTATGQAWQSLLNPRLAIFTGDSSSNFPNADLQRLEIITQDTPPAPVLVLQPQQLVFNAVAGQPLTNLQDVHVVVRSQDASINWSVTNTATWLQFLDATGNTPSTCRIGANPAGLAVGRYQAALQFSSPGVTSAIVNVTLIVNPAARASVATWKGAKRGAMTVSTDDSYFSGYSHLLTNNQCGSFMLWNVTPIPALCTEAYQNGMELGSHTVDHRCYELNEVTLRYQLETNIASIVAATPATQAEIISFAFPCGFSTINEQVVAADYFLAARGYNINQLEDPSPQNFAFLKGFNSHEHPPFPPANLKTVVDSAITQGKWFNLVLHSMTNDDGAIDYSVGKDIWVDALGTVAKYIQQRDRTMISNYVETAGQVSFNLSRLGLAATSKRNFETAITTNDLLTIQVDVTGVPTVFGLLTNGVACPYTNQVVSGRTLVLFNMPVTATAQSVLLAVSTNNPPVLSGISNQTVNELVTLTVTNTASDTDVPVETLTYTLVNPPVGASIDTNGVITWTPDESQGPGTNVIKTVVTDNGLPPLTATNSFTVVVNEVNAAPVLATNANVLVLEATTLTLTNTATDPDIPTNTLRFSLGAGAPAGLTLGTNTGVLSWTPTHAQARSNYLVTVVVTDNGVPPLSATNTFVVTVLASNFPPVLTVVTNRTVNELVLLTVTNAASDSGVPFETLSYALVNPPAGASIDTNGVITWTPDESQGPGTNVITTVVTDNGVPPLSATNSFTVVVNEVNAAPVLPAQADQFVYNFSAVVVTNTATDSDVPTNVLTYTLPIAPAGATISTNGIITWTPTAGVSPRTNFFQTVVTDTNPAAATAKSLKATNTFNIVIATNSAPLLPAQTNRTVNELAALIVTNTATDLDIAAGWPLINFSTTNIFNFTYTNRVALLADGWSFIATNPDASPRDTEITDTNIGAVVSYDQATRPGVVRIPCDLGDQYLGLNNSRNALFRNLPTAWLSMQVEFNFAPTADTHQAHLGLYQDDNNYVQIGLLFNSGLGGKVAAFVSEINGAFNFITNSPSSATNIQLRLDRQPATGVLSGYYSEDGMNWVALGTVSPAFANPRLEIWTGGATAPYSGQPNLDVRRVTVVQTNTSTLTYTLVNPPAGASIDTNGIIRWTPSESQGPGTNVIKTVVTDNGLPPLTATNSFTVVVNEVNAAPVLATNANVLVLEATTLTLTNTATDPDIPTNTLRFSLGAGAPAGLTLGTNTGVLNWTPTHAQARSNYLVTVVVTDNGVPPLSATNTFVVTVLASNFPPVLTVVTNRTVNELVLLTVTNAASDSGVPFETLSYALVNPPAGASIDTNGVITWTPDESQGPGTNVITTVVTDNGVPPLSATNSFTVVVNEVNVAPVLPGQADRTVYNLSTVVVTNTASDADVPANALTYTLVNPPVGAQISTNGIITWTPVAGVTPRTNFFQTVVTDTNPAAVNTQSLSATNSFTIVVATNSPPMLPVVPNVTVNELTRLQVTNTATDPDIINGWPLSRFSGTNILDFTYTNRVALLADGWSFIATNPDTTPRDTEITDTNLGAVVSYDQALHPGVLRIPDDLGDMYQGFNNTRNSLFRSLPTNWISVRLRATFSPTQNYQQLHLLLYQNDDNLVRVGRFFNSDVGGQRVAMGREIGGSDHVVRSLSVAETNVILRIDRDRNTGIISGIYSPDGTSWVFLQQLTVPFANLRLGIVVGGSPNGFPNADLEHLEILTEDLALNQLTYQLVSAPTNAAIDPNGIITWTPDANQGPSTNVITTVVTDDGLPPLSATNSFTVTVLAVHNGPVLGGISNQTIAELTQLIVTNAASSGDIPALALNYTLSGPAGASIDTNGVITWTPDESQGPGTNVLTTVVTDTGVPPLSATNSFTVVVTEVNVAPVLGVVSNRTLVGLTPLVVTNVATDADLPAQLLTYTLSGPVGASISTNGVITWTPGLGDVPGTNQFVTVASDGSLTATNGFTVTVLAVHNGPVLGGISNQTIAELTQLIVTNAASSGDIPALALNYTLSGPAGASIDTNGVITWTPDESQGPGTNVLTTVVTDTGVPPLSATNSFTVVVTEVNVAPVLGVVSNRTLVGLTPLVVTNVATDADLPAQLLTYTLSGPVGASISTNGVITWTPGLGDVPGTNQFVTVASDGSLTATNGFTVTVLAVHNGPVLGGISNQTIAELTQLIVTNAASSGDIPALALNYTLSGPAGASIDTNGVITWTPDESQGPGTNVLTTVVTDTGVPPLSATNSFTVVVTEVNVAPVLGVVSNRTLVGLTPLVVTNVATDADLPAQLLTYTLSGPVGASISTNGVITWTPGLGDVPGTNQFVTVASDGSLTATNGFTVTVLAPEPAPIIQSVGVAGGIISLTWSSVSNQVYRLEYNEHLGTTNWIGMAPDVLASGPTTSITNAVGPAGQRFYRILVVP